jgi:hypothetical protein
LSLQISYPIQQGRFTIQHIPGLWSTPQKPGFFTVLASKLILLLETQFLAIYTYMEYAVSWPSRYRGLTFPISIMAWGHCLYHSQKSDRKVPKVGSLPWVHNLGRCWIQVGIQDFGMAIG